MPTSRRHYRISFEEAVAAHDYIVRVFGGLPGIRDRAAIESAVGRPYTGYYRRIESKAAALVQSLALNHGFTDGNKRTAVAIMSLFLDKSRYMLLAENEQTLNIDVEQMVLDVVEHRMSFDALVQWFRERIAVDPTQVRSSFEGAGKG